MLDFPLDTDLVLIGGGHSHLAVIKKLAMRPIPGLRITLISRDIHTPYSGMLPGLIAGHYSFDEAHIDLRRLCQKAGIRLFVSRVDHIDAEGQCIHCNNRPPVRYDWLSINVGSQPALDSIEGAASVGIAVKPVHGFRQRWQVLIQQIQELGPSQKHKISIVGGGAASVEVALAMNFRLSQLNISATVELELVCAGDCLLPTHNKRVQNHFYKLLKKRNIQLNLNKTVVCAAATENGASLTFSDGTQLQTQSIIWTIHAGSLPWIQESDIACDDSGFIDVNQFLQSPSHPNIFAAGDTARFCPRPLPKSGVYAVRAGPFLAENLRRAIEGRTLKPFRPQTKFLSLLMTGDKGAVMSRGTLSGAGRWAWNWKDLIDRRFMEQYNQWVPEAVMDSKSSRLAAELPMRCGGCGAKVSSSILSRVVSKLVTVQNSDVQIGLHHPDDAAVINPPENKQWLQTVDYFRAFIDDPYLLGRIATNHCLSDIYAMGAEPHSAMAIATIPHSAEKLAEDTLSQLMQGTVDSLNEQQTSLIGGHSSEGAEMAIGLSVNGIADRDRLLTKGNLMVGDQLILTKALGTGTLFVANGLGQARGDWIETALQQMLISNKSSANIVHQHSARACTDVTGFGLIGHLLEMLRASTQSTTETKGNHNTLTAIVNFAKIPLLPGARECLHNEHLSSLHSDNLNSEMSIHNHLEFSREPMYPILFDPQTAGGLLVAVPAEHAQNCLDALHASDCPSAVIIGEIVSKEMRNGNAQDCIELR